MDTAATTVVPGTVITMASFMGIAMGPEAVTDTAMAVALIVSLHARTTDWRIVL